MLYTINYIIPKTRYQRQSRQILRGLNKQNLADWIAWINSKNGTYKLI